MHRLAMRYLTPAFLALPLVATSVGFAADKPASQADSGLGAKKATGPLLTKDELRKCLDQKDSLTSQDADLLKEQTALAAKKDEIEHIGEDLKTRVDTVDRTSAEAVAAYNDAVLTRDKQVSDYQARVDKFNAGVDQNKAAHDQYIQACGNRRYLEEDEAALRKGK